MKEIDWEIIASLKEKYPRITAEGIHGILQDYEAGKFKPADRNITKELLDNVSGGSGGAAPTINLSELRQVIRHHILTLYQEDSEKLVAIIWEEVEIYIQEALTHHEAEQKRETVIEDILLLFWEAQAAFDHGDDVAHMLRFGEATERMKKYFHDKANPTGIEAKPPASLRTDTHHEADRIEKLEEALEYIRGSLNASKDETLQAIADIAQEALRTEAPGEV